MLQLKSWISTGKLSQGHLFQCIYMIYLYGIVSIDKQNCPSYLKNRLHTNTITYIYIYIYEVPRRPIYLELAQDCFVNNFSETSQRLTFRISGPCKHRPIATLLFLLVSYQFINLLRLTIETVTRVM